MSFWNKKGCVWTNDQTGRTNLPFQTKKGYEWTQDQTGGENLPFQTKADTCEQGRSCIYPRIHSSRPNLLSGSDIVNLKHEVFMITSRFPSLFHNRDFPFILFLFLFFFFEILGILWEIFYYFSVNEMQIYNRLNIWRSFRRFSALLRVSSNAPRFPKIMNFLNVC